MSKADGTVTFSAEFDNKELAAQVDEATKKVESIEGKVKSLEKDRASAVREVERAQKQLNKEQEAYNAAVEKSVSAGEQAADAKKALLDAQQKLKGLEQKKLQSDAVLSGQIESTPEQYIGTYENSEQLSADLKNQQAEVQKLTKDWRTAQSAVERYDAALADAQAKVDAAAEGVRNAQASVSGIDANLEAANAELATATANAGGLSAKLQQTERKAKSLRKPIDTASAAVNRFLKRLKSLVLSAFIFTVISKGLLALKERLSAAISESEEASKAMSQLHGAVNMAAQPIINLLVPALTSLAHALTRAIVLAGNLFGKNFVKDASAAAKAIDKVGKAQNSIGGFDELNVMQKSEDGSSTASYDFDSGIMSQMKTELDGLLTIIADAALVIGCILCLTGHWGIGIALMAIGATILASEEAVTWGSVDGSVSSVLGALWQTIGSAMFVIGVVLLFAGQIGLGIGAIIAGAAITAVAVNWNSVSEFLQTPLGAAAGLLVGAALVVIGILLCCGGHIPLGIGLIAAGALVIGTTVAINWNGIVDALKTPLGSAVTLIGGVLLIVLGIILLCSGVGIPLGIGMIVAGAGFIAAPIAANWNAIKEKLTPVFSGALAIISGMSLVLGVLLCLSGAGIGLGLALIFAGLSGTKKAWSLSDNPVTRFVKNLANGVIAIINSIADAINDLFHIRFDGLSIAGKQIIPSFDTQILKIPSIPYLARGAVLPANEPFMAVVGDQKHGTNVEAPLETIQDAVNAVMAERDERMIAVLLQLVGVAERIEQKDTSVTIGDETIGRANDRYVQNRGVRVNSGAFSNAY